MGKRIIIVIWVLTIILYLALGLSNLSELIGPYPYITILFLLTLLSLYEAIKLPPGIVRNILFIISVLSVLYTVFSTLLAVYILD